MASRRPDRGVRGRPPARPPGPVKIVPAETRYATVREGREKGRVVEVVRTLVFGTLLLPGGLPKRSTASTTIDTSFVGRDNGTDRHQNSRERRFTRKNHHPGRQEVCDGVDFALANRQKIG